MIARTPPTPSAVRMPLIADFSADDSVDMRCPFWEFPVRCPPSIDPCGTVEATAYRVCRGIRRSPWGLRLAPRGAGALR